MPTMRAMSEPLALEQAHELLHDYAPRLEIDLAKITHNADTIVGMLAHRGVSVTGVTKAIGGSPEIARAWLASGVSALSDARIANLQRLRQAGLSSPRVLIRTPSPNEADVAAAEAHVSYNSELVTIGRLATAARSLGRPHGVMLMVELGDLREGLMPSELGRAARAVLEAPWLSLEGIGTNLACMSGVVPDDQKMAELSGLADAIESEYGLYLKTVSGGNSANLPWLLAGGDVGRVNDLRIGEALLLGHEPVHHRPIPELHTDAITLVAEVIESKRKPSQPSGALGDTPYERRLWLERKGDIQQAVLALGEQDTDQRGLRPPPGIELLGASSDHLVVHCTDRHLTVGDTVRFALDYRAMARAMYSPFVAKTYALTRATTDE